MPEERSCNPRKNLVFYGIEMVEKMCRVALRELQSAYNQRLIGLGTVQRTAHVAIEKIGGHTQDRLNDDGWIAELVRLSPAFIGVPVGHFSMIRSVTDGEIMLVRSI